jgi:hypothetical protein
MIPSPFRYEANFTPEDYETLGKLSLRWSHIDHVIANCLKRLLRLKDDVAQVRPSIPRWFEELKKYKRRIRAGGQVARVKRQAKRQKSRT